MKKETTLLLSFLVMLFPFAKAQESEPKFSMQEVSKTPCGDPLRQSDLYFTPDGYGDVLVTKVVDGETIAIKVRGGKNKFVKLGGVDAPDVKTPEGKISQQYLSGLVLGKRIDVLLHGSSDKDEELGGRISLRKSPTDVNLTMIEAGMGRYEESKYLTGYDTCMYKLAAEKSKLEKKGLWQRYFTR